MNQAALKNEVQNYGPIWPMLVEERRKVLTDQVDSTAVPENKV